MNGDAPPFLVGTAISVYQNSGDPNSNWGHFENKRKWHGMGPTINKNAKAGLSCDFWNRFEEDIKLAKDLGSNAFRFSLEWSRVMPQQGYVDDSAVTRYHAIFDCLEKHNMEPLVTLHHFVHPAWFDDLGGFLKEENIQVFVEWAMLAFRHFGRRAKSWATFNEPGVATVCGFLLGGHPPGHFLDFKGAGVHMLNMLRCHTAAYTALKAMPGGNAADVGIVHNVFWIEPRSKGLHYTHVKYLCRFLNKVWGNEVVLEYLRTGRYKYWCPFWRSVEFQEPGGRPGYDFFGLNHYSRGVMSFWLQPTTKPGEIMVDMDYPIHPPSIYRAIAYVSQLNVPIYITENGVPRTVDDDKRTLWINGYLGQVQRAVEEGYDVRGYMYWTLMDNFEWNFSWELKFGLYEWNPEGVRCRQLRDGSKAILKWYAELPSKLGAILAAKQLRGERKVHAPTHAITAEGIPGFFENVVASIAAPMAATLNSFSRTSTG